MRAKVLPSSVDQPSMCGLMRLSMYLWGSTFLDRKLTGIVRMMVLMKDGKMTIAM